MNVSCLINRSINPFEKPNTENLQNSTLVGINNQNLNTVSTCPNTEEKKEFNLIKSNNLTGSAENSNKNQQNNILPKQQENNISNNNLLGMLKNSNLFVKTQENLENNPANFSTSQKNIGFKNNDSPLVTNEENNKDQSDDEEQERFFKLGPKKIIEINKNLPNEKIKENPILTNLDDFLKNTNDPNLVNLINNNDNIKKILLKLIDNGDKQGSIIEKANFLLKSRENSNKKEIIDEKPKDPRKRKKDSK